MMGVLLYGTETTKFQDEGNMSYPNCYLLADLDIPSSDDVKALRDLVQDDEESARLLVPLQERASMANVLFCANQLFTTKAPNFASRRLFIVTDEDNPYPKDQSMRSAATVRAKDLYDLGVTIELFPISRPGSEFDRSKFYNDIIYNHLPIDPDAPAPVSGVTPTTSTKDGISLLYSLLSAVNSKAVARRAQFSSMPFEIGPGFKISVKGYILFKKQVPHRSCYIWLEGEKPLIAKGTTSRMAEDSGRTVEKVEIKKAFKFGGEQILFTPEEVQSLRTMGDPVIRIIGFKPASLIPIWANKKPATFIYPSEEDYVGSTRVFSALYQKLLKDKLVGLAWFIARKNATPTIAAILPSAEEFDDNGVQSLPQGLWLHPLPFADDIRANPETTLIRAPENLINPLRDIIKSLQLPKNRYDPARYPNPALQWHYRILQAMALEEDIPEKPDDKTVPKYRQIEKRTGEWAAEWRDELTKAHNDWRDAQGEDFTAPPAKRKGVAAELVDRGKKVKSEDVEGPSDEEMRKAFDSQKLAKLTIAQLAGWLKGKGLKGTGKKADLVERAEEWFESK